MLTNSYEETPERGFTVTELIVVTLVVFALGFLVLAQYARGNERTSRIKCVSNLKNVALGFRIFATDNNNRFPGWGLWSNAVNVSSIQVTDVFGLLSNELSTPKILACPEDAKRKNINSFTNLAPKNISYFASLTADETEPHHLLAGDRNILVNGTPAAGVLPLTTNTPVSWSKEIHVEQGNVAMGDGSVQQLSTSRLQQAIRDQDTATNYLVFP